MRRAVLTVVLSVALAGCGAEAPPPGPAAGGGRLDGTYVGQEVFLTYQSPEHAAFGRRTNRTREEARALAEDLRARALAGEDLGALARTWSNAPGGAADGYSGVLPVDPLHPTPRDRALAAVEVGALTPVFEWQGGFWFLRRVDPAQGRALRDLFEQRARERASFRAIALLYRGAWVADPAVRERVTRSREEARALAEGLLARALAGEDFAALARAHSEDQSAEEGGLVTLPDAQGRPTPWIRRQEPGVPEPVLDVVFRDPPGAVHPRVIETERGVFVIRTEDRRRVDPER